VLASVSGWWVSLGPDALGARIEGRVLVPRVLVLVDRGLEIEHDTLDRAGEGVRGLWLVFEANTTG
jgi:hypothetical protein